MSVALRGPSAVGRKFTANSHTVPGASTAPVHRSYATLKSPGWSPPTASPNTVTGTSAVFTTVTSAGDDDSPTSGDPKSFDVGDMASEGTPAVATTPTETVTGSAPASATTTSAEAGPSMLGAKATSTVHDSPGITARSGRQVPPTIWKAGSVVTIESGRNAARPWFTIVVYQVDDTAPGAVVPRSRSLEASSVGNSSTSNCHPPSRVVEPDSAGAPVGAGTPSATGSSDSKAMTRPVADIAGRRAERTAG